MPLSTSWNLSPHLYSPNDDRLEQIKMILISFNGYLYSQNDGAGNPSTTQITGSTAWLWYLRSISSKNVWTHYYLYGAATDIDLRNIVEQKSEEPTQFYKERIALYDLAHRSYFFHFTCPPVPNDYAQITFSYGRKLDWTISTTTKAPLHNYDIFCVVKDVFKIQFHLPNFPGAENSRNAQQFLLNPKIFILENNAPSFKQDEFEKSLFKKDSINLNKILAWVIKTLCKISVTGITIAEHTQIYLNALAVTAATTNTTIRPLQNVNNASILQSILASFYCVYYKPAANDERFIFEKALRLIKVESVNGTQSLYNIFANTIRLEYFNGNTSIIFNTRISSLLQAVLKSLPKIIAPKPDVPVVTPAFTNRAQGKIPSFGFAAAIPATPAKTTLNFSAAVQSNLKPPVPVQTASPAPKT